MEIPSIKDKIQENREPNEETSQVLERIKSEENEEKQIVTHENKKIKKPKEIVKTEDENKDRILSIKEKKEIDRKARLEKQKIKMQEAKIKKQAERNLRLEKQKENERKKQEEIRKNEIDKTNISEDLENDLIAENKDVDQRFNIEGSENLKSKFIKNYIAQENGEELEDIDETRHEDEIVDEAEIEAEKEREIDEKLEAELKKNSEYGVLEKVFERKTSEEEKIVNDDYMDKNDDSDISEARETSEASEIIQTSETSDEGETDETSDSSETSNIIDTSEIEEEIKNSEQEETHDYEILNEDITLEEETLLEENVVEDVTLSKDEIIEEQNDELNGRIKVSEKDINDEVEKEKKVVITQERVDTSNSDGELEQSTKKTGIRTKIIIGVVAALLIVSIIILLIPKTGESKSIAIDKAAQDYYYTDEFNKSISSYETLVKNNPDDLLIKAKLSAVYAINNELDKSNKMSTEAIQDVLKKTYTAEDGPEIVEEALYAKLLTQNDTVNAIKLGESSLLKYNNSIPIIKGMLPLYSCNGNSNKTKLLINSYGVALNGKSDTDYANVLFWNGNVSASVDELLKCYADNADNLAIYETLAKFRSDTYNENIIVTELNNRIKRNPANKKIYEFFLANIYASDLTTIPQAQACLSLTDVLPNSNSRSFLEIKIDGVDNEKNDTKEVNTLIKNNPENANVYYEAALYNVTINDKDTASKYAKKALQLNPNISSVYVYVLEGIAKANKQSGIGYTYESFSIEPYNYTFMFNAGEYYIKTNKDVGERMLNLSYGVAGTNYDYLHNAALILANDGDTADGEKLLLTLTQKRKNVDDYRDLGVMYFVDGDLKKGVSATTKALNMEQNDAKAYNNEAYYSWNNSKDISSSNTSINIAASNLNGLTKDEINTIRSNQSAIHTLKDKYDQGENISNQTLNISLLY